MKKYYSDLTKKLYETEEECDAAEKEFAEQQTAEQKKREERAARAKEVEDAYNHYLELLEKFLDDYNYYVDYKKNKGRSMFDIFFTNWPF